VGEPAEPTVNGAVTVAPAVAEIVTVVVAATVVVFTLKIAVVTPAATVTLAGTVAAAVLPLERVTAVPPLGAAFVRVTVPVEEPPPVTVAGFSVTPDTTAAEVCTVKVVLLVIPLMAAVIVALPALWLVANPLVLIVAAPLDELQLTCEVMFCVLPS
jgi:hypothetical protein